MLHVFSDTCVLQKMCKLGRFWQKFICKSSETTVKLIQSRMGYSLDVFLPDIHPKVQMTITATF